MQHSSLTHWDCKICHNVISVPALSLANAGFFPIKYINEYVCDQCAVSVKPLGIVTPKNHSKYIYLLRCNEFCKIGVTKNLDTRSWKTDNPYDMILLKTWLSPIPTITERKMHRFFEQYHHRGEWFILPESVIDWLITQNTSIDTLFG